jgi:hypothetical protein
VKPPSFIGQVLLAAIIATAIMTLATFLWGLNDTHQKNLRKPLCPTCKQPLP